jgi:preprotein translocase subunit YajC
MFINQAIAAEAAGQQAASPYSSIIMLVLFGLVFYFLLIRPQSKRQKEHKAMLEAIQKGDEVVTSGGILGKVLKLTDNFIVLNVGDKVEMRFQRASISATLPKGTIKSINEES